VRGWARRAQQRIADAASPLARFAREKGNARFDLVGREAAETSRKLGDLGVAARGLRHALRRGDDVR